MSCKSESLERECELEAKFDQFREDVAYEQNNADRRMDSLGDRLAKAETLAKCQASCILDQVCINARMIKIHTDNKNELANLKEANRALSREIQDVRYLVLNKIDEAESRLCSAMLCVSAGAIGLSVLLGIMIRIYMI